MVHQDESVWVNRARDGDPEAIGWLYERYCQRIYRYVLLRVGDPTEAEDITEQVFLKVIESISGFQWQKSATFSAWLYRIAHNLVIDAGRRSMRRVHVPLEPLYDVLPAEVGDPHPYAERRDTLGHVAAAMEELTDLQTQVILLRYAAEFSTTEIAEVLGRTPNGIAVLQHQALKKLNSAMMLKGYRQLTTEDGGNPKTKNARKAPQHEG